MTIQARDDENPFEEYCPSCGKYLGGESICPHCGSTVYNEEGFEEVNEDEEEDEEF
jgi:hypothetical protein